MKGNELLEKIYSGEIENNTKIEVLNKDGSHIAFIEYINNKINWISGQFDTSYLCNEEIEFKIVKREWEIERLDLKNMYTGDKVKFIEDKVNEIIDKLNKMNEPLPF